MIEKLQKYAPVIAAAYYAAVVGMAVGFGAALAVGKLWAE